MRYEIAASAEGSDGLDEPQSLDPRDIQIAVSAYESVLQRLNGTTDDSTRETLARLIVRSMFTGERDPARLRESAWAQVGGSVPSLRKSYIVRSL